MTDITITHEFDCDEDVFWDKCFLDDEFNRRLYLERLRFPVWRVVRQEAKGDAIERSIEIQPRVKDMPGPMMKIIGDKFGYTEQGTVDKKAHRYRFRIIPSVLTDKTRVDGEMTIETIGPKKIRRVVRIHIEIKVFGLGGMLEQRSADDTRKSYEVSAEFTRGYLRDQGL